MVEQLLARITWISLAISAIALPACTRKKGHSSDGPKIVHFVFRDDVKAADPAQANDVISAEFTGHIFEGLVEYSYLGRGDSVVPLLAAGMPVFSNKNKTLTFRIRPGVFFQDDPAFPSGKGREVTAEDFVYSFKRIVDPRLTSPNWWMFDGLIEGANDWRSAIEKAPADQRDALFEKPFKGITTKDPMTLVINLTKPYPQLLQILAMTHACVVSREVVQKYGPEIINHPVGTGPFRLKSWIRGSKIIVEKNPTYRKEFYPTVGTEEDRKSGLLQAAAKPIPFVQEIQWDIIKEDQPMWLKFRNGDLDRVAIPKDNFLETIGPNGELKADLVKEGIVLHKFPALTSWWLAFNMKDPLLGKNLKLRQAIALAFDRARALEVLHNNRGVLADSPIPPSIEGGSNMPPNPYAFNLAKAKALLAEAGYPEGKGLPELSFDLRGPDTNNRQLGEFMRENLAKLGLQVNILANSFPEALEKLTKGHFQMTIDGWVADYPDPENFLQLFYSKNAAPGPNHANFMNKDYDALYEQIRTQTPSPERSKAVAKMIEILQREAPASFFYHPMEYQVTWKWLRNYKPNLFFYSEGKYIDLER